MMMNKSLPTQHVTMEEDQRRHRTLDDLPMLHGLEDAVRMRDRRRDQQQSDQSKMAAARREIRTMSSYSRRKFDAAMSARQGEREVEREVGRGVGLPQEEREAMGAGLAQSRPKEEKETAAPDQNSLLYFQPVWLRPRLSVASYAGRDDAKPPPLSTRPESEPAPRSRSPWCEKTFNHARGTPDPRIKQLVENYNAELKVVCPRLPFCTQTVDNRPLSYATDVLLLPLDKPKPENVERSASEHFAPDIEVETLESKMEDEITLQTIKFIETTSQPNVDEQKLPSATTNVPQPNAPHITESTEKVLKGNSKTTVLSASSTHQPQPSPQRCWVDYATVSSLELELPTYPATPFADRSPSDIPPKSPRSQTTSYIRKRSKRAIKSKTELEHPSPPESHGVPHEMQEEGEEEVVEEEESRPVLPLSFCPSSSIKAREAEVKLWLRKSSFSAASRAVDIILS